MRVLSGLLEFIVSTGPAVEYVPLAQLLRLDVPVPVGAVVCVRDAEFIQVEFARFMGLDRNTVQLIPIKEMDQEKIFTREVNRVLVACLQYESKMNQK